MLEVIGLSQICVSMTVGYFCFFFSSRRRHTRCSRDWSSDVCSSDLADDPARRIVIAGGGNIGLRLATTLEPHNQVKIIERDARRARRIAELLENTRSEEHTSELQSRLHLVCRLLLEKKNNINMAITL